MSKLSKFHADFQVKAEVKAYLLGYLEQLAIKRAFKGEDSTGIKESVDIINKAFKDLDKMFEPERAKKQRSFK